MELNIEEEQMRTALVHKLTEGSISLTEAQELRNLLERERHMLTQLGNCLAFFAARFLIDCVDEYLKCESNSQQFHVKQLKSEQTKPLSRKDH